VESFARRFGEDFRGYGVRLACRGLLQGFEREIDNQMPWRYIVGDRNDEGRDALAPIEMGNPS